jgi:hypothetical protein
MKSTKAEKIAMANVIPMQSSNHSRRRRVSTELRVSSSKKGPAAIEILSRRDGVGET